MSTGIFILKRWFDRGQASGHSHMIVMCDTFDWEDYPVYVNSADEAREYVRTHHQQGMQKVMEVYNLHMTFLEQSVPGTRVFNY